MWGIYTQSGCGGSNTASLGTTKPLNPLLNRMHSNNKAVTYMNNATSHFQAYGNKQTQGKSLKIDWHRKTDMPLRYYKNYNELPQLCIL